MSPFFLFLVFIIMEDLKIVEQCILWNLDSFSILYDRYIDKIYKFIFLKVSNREISEDITQDVFFSAIKNIEKFKINENSSFKSWIYTIANNKVIDFYKTNKNLQNVWEYLDIYENIDFQENIDNKDKLKEVFEYLHKFKKEHREVFILRIWDDLSYKEISEITWLKEDNCKKIVSRILKNINSNLVILLLALIIK